ncbi:hypothetical protein Nepgr_018112 [Nepenthes gracilis]|uniref:Uncharacterized protein n=1 Tax=Nepenthes gracilis TaxID=150966 RepID=A0AAD3ST51_NEPGR|nr:hypothetical protein Nepgr_018112 [Nepenthes gracilis]
MMERQLILNEVRESFYKFPEKFVDLSDEEVKAIHQSVLNGTYSLSPSRLISFERGDPIQDRFSYILNFSELPTHSFALYIEPEDDLILVALESLLQNQILPSSTLMRNSFKSELARGHQRETPGLCSLCEASLTGLAPVDVEGRRAESVALIARVESAGSDSDSDERFSQWKLCTNGKVEGKVASNSRSSAVKENSANSIVSARARSELALNKNKLGFLLATMNECFLIEQKE